MGRANQFNSGGGIFHVTHRCHNRAFLLKFGRDRDAYRAILRQQLEEFEVWLLDYCVTMVRCGVVSHPRDWGGGRRRYRLLDMDRLFWRLATDNAEEIQGNLEAALADAIARGELKREPIWTESLAVGSAGLVEKIKPMVMSRRETEVIGMEEGVSVLQESASPYGQETAPKNVGKVIL